jgi:hypothetical protein
MSAVVSELRERSERPAYVRFETRPLEDKKASEEAGHYVAKDVEFAIITPCYSKDELHFRVDKWMVQMDDQVRNGRMPAEWAKQYKQAYQAWKEGLELPLNGTPIKGWPILSPAMQENLIRLNIKTVEDLAGINDDAAKMIGMGAINLKNKANAWLSQAKDKGPATMEIARLKQQTENQSSQIEKLTAQLEEFRQALKSKRKKAEPSDEE